MTQDIARMESNAVAVLGQAGDALDQLGRWVAAARDAHALVSPLVDTAFVPEAYKPKVHPNATDKERNEARAVAVANATAAVLQGITLGLDPLTSLQQIYIVHGRPGMYTEIKVALVKSRGHEVWTEDISDTRAVVCGRRKGTEYTERVTVTMDQARKAGWTTNQAYMKTPQDILYARAAARVCDRIAPDVLMGIASVEEIQDSIQTTAEVGNGHRTVSPRKRAMAPIGASSTTTNDYDERVIDDAGNLRDGRGTILHAAEDPLLEEEPWPTVQTPPAPTANQPSPDEQTSTSRTQEDDETQLLTAEPTLPVVGDITGAQSRMMYGLLRQVGKADPIDALAYIVGVTGRGIGSTKELTKGEAKKVIDALNAEINAEPEL